MNASHSEAIWASSADEKKNVKVNPATTVITRDTTSWSRRKIIVFVDLIVLVSGLVAIVIALPIVLCRYHSGFQGSIPSDSGVSQNPSDLGFGGPFRSPSEPAKPMMVVHNFPDPGLIEYNGTWYAFGTNQETDTNATVHVPIASSSDFKNWTLLSEDALPVVGPWEVKMNHWAPDVIRRDDGKFVLYYSGQVKKFDKHHCIGAAVSNGTSPLGPYHPQDLPLACPRKYGGAIDPAPFRDVDGKLYVTYKSDGNSVGNGGDCNNGIYPLISTPIMLQEMESDGITPVGDPIEILDHISSDGPLVEAPRIIRIEDGIYYLTFSSHCAFSSQYDVKYATSTSVKGPYQRASRPLLQTGDYNLVSPGGASISSDGTKMVFHADCGDFRCMYAAALNITRTSIDFAVL